MATVALAIAPGKLETVTKEEAPAGSLSGMATGKFWSKRRAVPMLVLPEGREKWLVRVSWSDLINMVRSMTVPHTKRGEVLILKGRRLELVLPTGISG